MFVDDLKLVRIREHTTRGLGNTIVMILRRPIFLFFSRGSSNVVHLIGLGFGGFATTEAAAGNDPGKGKETTEVWHICDVFDESMCVKFDSWG
jgi:hypothetical protein